MNFSKFSLIILCFVAFMSCQSTPSVYKPYDSTLTNDPVLAKVISLKIEDIQDNKELDISNFGITNLEGIEQLEYITKLKITSHHIESLSPLQNMLKLKELTLSIKNIGDLNLDGLQEALPLCKITTTKFKPHYIGEIGFPDPEIEKAIIEYHKSKLKIGIGRSAKSPGSYFRLKWRDPRFTLRIADVLDLKLKRTGVTQLAGLELLTNLKELEISEQVITDLDVINEMSSLKNAIISIRGLNDIEALKKSRPDVRFYLKELPFVVEEVIKDKVLKEIIEKQYNDVSSKIEMFRVTSLTINNQIESLSGLEYATELESFRIENSAITDLSPISSCKKLVSLVIDSCSITDLSPFEKGFPYLRRIEIYNNKGDIDFTPLQGQSLERLIAKDSNISDISGLKKMSIYTLDLSGNNISDISSLSSIGFLESLNLQSNNISDISSLSSLDYLKILNLSSNKVENDGLYNLPVMLQDLNIENNNITSYEGLISNLKLKIISIFGNPNTNEDDNVLQGLRKRRVLITGITKNK